MSLTLFLSKNQDVRDHFRQYFRKPSLTADIDLLAPPLSNRYSTVGTAFDYLLRFYIKRINPEALETKWVAEWCLTSLASPILSDVIFDVETNSITSFNETEFSKRAERIIDQAKSDYFAYLRSGNMTNGLIKSSICLAQLDPIYRAGFVDDNMGDVHNEDVEDLRNLISIVDPKVFAAGELCALNPRFGQASHLVGGADADLLIDDMLIDIKTTKKFDFQAKFFYQLMGYAVLHEIGGVEGLMPKPPVAKAGVYFARHAYLHVFQLDDVMNRADFPEFVRWFKERAAMQCQPMRSAKR